MLDKMVPASLDDIKKLNARLDVIEKMLKTLVDNQNLASHPIFIISGTMPDYGKDNN